jgi:hypothetical protein
MRWYLICNHRLYVIFENSVLNSAINSSLTVPIEGNPCKWEEWAKTKVRTNGVDVQHLGNFAGSFNKHHDSSYIRNSIRFSFLVYYSILWFCDLRRSWTWEDALIPHKTNERPIAVSRSKVREKCSKMRYFVLMANTIIWVTIHILKKAKAKKNI